MLLFPSVLPVNMDGTFEHNTVKLLINKTLALKPQENPWKHSTLNTHKSNMLCVCTLLEVKAPWDAGAKVNQM